ncbi:MAG TPA: ATP-binding protein [Pirellulales bacterium]|jgi:serine/threonine-protein kinase RsbT|nr:ATP-binding protein [Pirellulales bacterium]
MATATTSDTLPLQTEHDIVVCRQMVRKLTQELVFSLVDQTKMVTAASELARNTVIYGGGGRLHWAVLREGTRAGLRLSFEDEGPGIPDVAQAMTDGWTSGTGLGLGLSGAKRLVNEFHIDTQAGKGTRVTIARWK